MSVRSVAVLGAGGGHQLFGAEEFGERAVQVEVAVEPGLGLQSGAVREQLTNCQVSPWRGEFGEAVAQRGVRVEQAGGDRPAGQRPGGRDLGE